MGNSLPSISIRPGLRPREDYSSLASRQGIKSGSSSLPVISQCLFGEEHGPRGCFRRWEENFVILLDSVPPASRWAAPSQLGVVPPRSAFFIGCMGIGQKLTSRPQVSHQAIRNKERDQLSNWERDQLLNWEHGISEP